MRGTNAFLVGDQEPCAVCTPRFSATGPENAQAGSAAFESALPDSISSLTQLATCCQPAACQFSNGPVDQPKPQRSAKSTSRALSAMDSKCTAVWGTASPHMA